MFGRKKRFIIAVKRREKKEPPAGTGGMVGKNRKVPVAERICRGLELLRSEEAGIDKETRQKMETILYALAVKLLDAKALEQVKEKMGMTLLGEMLVEDGMQKGRREGRLEGELLKLVSQIRKKMLRGCQEEQIADLLEEDIQTVEKICRTVSAHPEKDDQGICQLLMESEKTDV